MDQDCGNKLEMSDEKIEWEEKYWEASDYFGYKKLLVLLRGWF